MVRAKLTNAADATQAVKQAMTAQFHTNGAIPANSAALKSAAALDLDPSTTNEIKSIVASAIGNSATIVLTTNQPGAAAPVVTEESWSSA